MSRSNSHTADQCARVWFALQQAHARVAATLTKALEEECGLSINEFEVLLQLDHAEPGTLRVTDLCPTTQLSQPALSRLVTRLEEQGLVERSESTTDRRAVTVRLTPKGRDLLQRAIPIHAACVHETLSGWLTDEEQQILVKALSRSRP
jgi:DNA-binding MarR family transcriptional regulator